MEQKNYTMILALYRVGKTQVEIAKEVNLTRQRVQQVIKAYASLQDTEEYIRNRLKIRSDKQKERKKCLSTRFSAECVVCGVTFLSAAQKSHCSARCVASHKVKYYSRKPGESDTEYNRNRHRAYYKGSESYRENVKRINRKQIEKSPKKIQARSAVNSAIIAGTLKKPDVCSGCHLSRNEVVRLEAHHEDYDKPLYVIWLCTRCHVSTHMVKNSTPLIHNSHIANDSDVIQ